VNRRLIAAIAAVAALAGCSPSADIVARVGNATITTEDFALAAKQNGNQYAQFGDSAKFMFMDDLVKRALLIEGAKASGLYRDSTFLDFSVAARDRAGREALLRSYQVAGVGVSDAEARALYARLGVESHVRVIVTSTREMAAAARERIASGMPFEQAATLFNTTGLTPAGGDAGWLAAGVLPPVLDAVLNTVPVGELVGPLESSGQGWFLMRIDERREATPAPFDEMRGPIVDRLRQRKTRAVFMRTIDRLKVEYDVHLATEGSTLLARLLRGPLDEGMGRLQPGTNGGLTPAQLATPLGYYRGGVYTMGDVIADLGRGATAPNLSMAPMVARWIEGQTLERALKAEVRARHMAEEPATRRSIRTQEEGFLLDGYYSREVMSAIVLSPEALQAEYALRQRELSRLDAVQVAYATVPDSNAAMAVATAARSGSVHSLAEAVAQAAPGVEMRTEVVRFPNQDPFWMGQVRNLMMMREGGVAGPFPSEQGFRFVQLLARSQHTPRWEELDPEIVQQLQSLAIERQREARFAVVTDSLRRAFPVSVDRAKLEKLEWPLEAMIPPGMGMPVGN